MILRILLAIPLMWAATTHAQTTRWKMDASQSALTFFPGYQGQELNGHFNRFATEIGFDENNLAQSFIRASIDVASLDTGNQERDSILSEAAWLHFSAYPQAEFQTQSIKKVGDHQYEAQAELTIKGHTEAITFPFSWQLQGESAVLIANLNAEVWLNRVSFDVGVKEFPDDSAVNHRVRVGVALKLSKQ